MGGYCLVTRTSSESIFITELSSIDLLGFSFHFNKYDELISAKGHRSGKSWRRLRGFIRGG